MAVDIEDLIIELQGEVNPPGQNNFSTAVDDEWITNLRNAFWEARVFGFWANYTEAEGFIAPITGTEDLGRDQQQLIVLFAAARIIRNVLMNTPTEFRAEAGPVNFETQNSATLLVAILKDIRSKVDLAMAAIGSITNTTVTYIDSIIGRQDSLNYGNSVWVL